MSDEVTQPQPEEPIVEPTAVADMPGAPQNEPPVVPAHDEEIVSAPVVESTIEPEPSPAEEPMPPSPQPEPVVPAPEPFKMRAGVNCTVDGGQVKPL